MHCAACAGNVEKIVRKQEGVENASVNLAAATLAVTYNPVSYSSSVREIIWSVPGPVPASSGPNRILPGIPHIRLALTGRAISFPPLCKLPLLYLRTGNKWLLLYVVMCL